MSERWTLHHADCLDVLRSMPDESVDHVITDPPYTQRTSDNARSAPDGSNGTNLHLARAFISFAGVDELESAIASECLRVANRWVVIFCALEQIGKYAAAAGKAWIRSGVWVRTNSAPQFTGDRPGQGCEGVAIMHRAGRKRWNRGGHPAVWTGETINAVRNPDRGIAHPTPKPVWLMSAMLEAFTDPGETILDPFAGSGTTGVAALRLGRKFIGVEKDATYEQLARDRLSAEEQGSTLTAARAGQLAMFAKKAGGT